MSNTPPSKPRLKSPLGKALIALCFFGVGAFLLFFFLLRPFEAPKLLERSEPDTVSLVWEFYACGGDCPYYRVLSADKEAHGKYVGQMADIQGIDVWQNYNEKKDSAEERDALYSAIASTDKFVCRGRFALFSKPSYWECCMDSDNLIFEAEECRQTARTYEERCMQNRWIYREYHNRDLDSLPQAAEAGEAEAQYLLGDVYRQGIPCYPQNTELAEYWLERAAAQGHGPARQFLDEMRQEAEQDATDAPDHLPTERPGFK